MNLSHSQKLVFVRGEAIHGLCHVMWRKHAETCKAMHRETQEKRKQILAEQADWIYDAIDAAESYYNKEMERK